MGFSIKRFDGKTFGPFATEDLARESASGLLRDWMEGTDRVAFYRGSGDGILRAVVQNYGEDTDESLKIVPVV